MEVCQIEVNDYIRSDAEITKKKLPYIKDIAIDQNENHTWTEPKPILVEKLRPVEAVEVGNSSVQGPFPCTVSNPQTGLAWRPKGRRVTAVIGPEDGLHYWTVTSSHTGQRVFIFGHNLAGHWRYATVNLDRKKVIFRSNDLHPAFIDVEGKINDKRAFFLKESNHSSGRFLVPALDEDLAVAIKAKKRMLTLVNSRRAHPWTID